MSNQVSQKSRQKPEAEYNLIDWFVKCMKNYANFRGRARRKEYWFFFLSRSLIMIAAIFLDAILFNDAFLNALEYCESDDCPDFNFVITILASLAFFIPEIAVGARRLHDTNKSGWWYLLSLIPLFGTLALIALLAIEGDQTENRYGPPPK
ncbi:Inner membrane protein yhaH [Moraxella cuniculi]|uniref:Inner membrane protein yhaH n=1 Tax=Moraxella cuniculi TaxID=34061 RepID=A0A3S4R631_9GAMM|nr:DUF805 domain-containing protein [Moraxella cuniculi]VEG13554.1 Inner membrane protein yhaH [Moraxella cuniculi]